MKLFVSYIVSFFLEFLNFEFVLFGEMIGFVIEDYKFLFIDFVFCMLYYIFGFVYFKFR